MQKKQFSLASVVLSAVCIVYVTEAAAPVAAIGNSQFFWWLFMLLFFLLPYGLVASELGSTYPGEGGIYNWVKMAFPHSRWAARVAWCNSINLPIYIASLAVMVPQLLGFAFGIHFNLLSSLAIELAVIWSVAAISRLSVSENISLLNASAVIKIILALLVGFVGLYFGIKNGFANDMSPRTFLPAFNLESLRYVSVIIFNLMGFEIICTYADAMPNPKKQIPQGVALGGLLIATIYLLGGVGIGAAISIREISTSTGLVDSFLAMGIQNKVFLAAVALMFIITLFGSMVSWALGVNAVSAYAADRGDLPAVFGRRGKGGVMPSGAILMNGLISSLVCFAGTVMSTLNPEFDLFWIFFSTELVVFLLVYIPVFPAFLKLRAIDPHAERPFAVPGGRGVLRVLAAAPMVLILVSIGFTALPLSADVASDVFPTFVGSFAVLLIGEISIALRSRGKNKDL